MSANDAVCNEESMQKVCRSYCSVRKTWGLGLLKLGGWIFLGKFSQNFRKTLVFLVRDVGSRIFPFPKRAHATEKSGVCVVSECSKILTSHEEDPSYGKFASKKHI